MVVPIAAHVQPLEQRVELVEDELGPRPGIGRRAGVRVPHLQQRRNARGASAAWWISVRVAPLAAAPRAGLEKIAIDEGQPDLDARPEELQRRHREAAVELAQIQIAAASAGESVVPASTAANELARRRRPRGAAASGVSSARERQVRRDVVGARAQDTATSSSTVVSS